MKTDFQDLALDAVLPSPNNPRKQVGDLTALVESIKAVGVAQPVLVRPIGDVFELVFGHRRLAASRFAGLKTIPAMIRELGDDGSKKSAAAAAKAKAKEVAFAAAKSVAIETARDVAAKMPISQLPDIVGLLLRVLGYEAEKVVEERFGLKGKKVDAKLADLTDQQAFVVAAEVIMRLSSPHDAADKYTDKKLWADALELFDVDFEYILKHEAVPVTRPPAPAKGAKAIIEAARAETSKKAPAKKAKKK